METFLTMYERLDSDNLHLLTEVYRSDIQFIDPAHEIMGLDNMTRYFASLYQDLDSIHFVFHNVMQSGNSSYLQWDMTFRHRRLLRGEPITVAGATFLKFDEDRKVYYHRDYFDLGAMLYEHLPLFGRLITYIKLRLGK